MATDNHCRILVTLMQRGGRMYSAVLPETVEGRFRFEGTNQRLTQIPVSINGKNGAWFVESEEGATIHQEGKPIDGKSAPLPLDDSHGLNIALDDNKELFVLHVERIEQDSLSFCRYEIQQDTSEITIGRVKSNTVFYQCPYVSEVHAVLRKENDEWYILDNNSTNGTYVNGIALNRKKRLAAGDLIYIMGLYLIYGASFIAVNKTRDIDAHPTCVIDDSRLRMLPPEDEAWFLSLPRKGPNSTFIQYPRRKFHLEAEKIEINQPPMALTGNSSPLLMRLASPLLMGARSIAGGNVSMALSSMVLPFMSQGITEKEKNEYNEKRVEWYAQYCLQKAEEIKKEKEREETVLEKIHPSLESLLRLEDKTRLWEFRFSDPDFLQLRIGAQIRMPMIADIQWPKDDFVLPGERDLAKEHLEDLKKDHYDLTDVPALISLKDAFIIGILSQEPSSAPHRVAVNLIVRLALTHGYDDVKIVILAAPEDTAEIAPYIKLFRFLPHCWDDYRETRFIAETQEDVLSISNHIKKSLDEKPTPDNNKKTAYVVFAFSRSLLDGFGILKGVIANKNYSGISIVTAFDTPLKESQMLIRMEGEKKGKLVDLFSAEDKDIDFRLETFDQSALWDCMKTLFRTKLQVDGKAFSLPKSYSFMEMINIGKLEDMNFRENWMAHLPWVSLAAPVGIGTHGELIYLDLHQKSHGPHGLIAGTTGSGKSEFIITYILSLAVNFSPDEVAFVLIDYKGGGLVDAFVDSKPDPIHGEKYHLPHVLGTITNLDGSSIQRCLSSLQAELMRRQQKFREAMEVSNEGKMEIYEYQKLYRDHKISDPIPHLFLIADEFAELKQKEPEFMETLISIARIGRSLGVHLILATQKPSGVVNEQIWSNTRFRVCLKVQDRSDSQEMLKRPEAASIKNIGRFYLQVGQDEIFSLGQSAYCGAKYHPSDRVEKQIDETVVFLDNTGQPRLEKKPAKPKKKADQEEEKSQLVATVTTLTEFIRKEENRDLHRVQSIWLPSLIDQKTIPFDSVDREYRASGAAGKQRRDMTAVLGRVDDPTHIAQFTLAVDLMEIRHIMICGTAGSGKSTLLFTFLYSLSRDYSPDELQYYIFDCSGGVLKMFDQLPHCGAYIHDGGEAEFQSIQSFLEEKTKERKKLFEEAGVNNFREFKDTDEGKRITLPMILFVIDSYSKEAVGISAHTNFYQYVREAALFGIQIVLSANSLGEIYTKMKDEMSYHLALHAVDKYAYQDILGVRSPFVPADKPGHGMCLVREEKDARVLEWKAAVVAGEVDEENRKAEQARLVEQLAEKYSGYQKAPFWKQVNVDQTYDEFCETFAPGRIPLGFYQGAATPSANPGDPISIPLRQMGTMGIYFGRQQLIPQVFGNVLHALRRERMQVTIIRKSSRSLFDSENMKDMLSSLVLEQQKAVASGEWGDPAIQTLPEANEKIASFFNDRFQDRIRKWSDYKTQKGIVNPTDQEKRDYFKNHTTPWAIVVENGSDFYRFMGGIRDGIWNQIEEDPDVVAQTHEINLLDERMKQLTEQLQNADNEADRAAAKEEIGKARQAQDDASAKLNERIQYLAGSNPLLSDIEFFSDLFKEGIAHIMNVYLILLSDQKEDARVVSYIGELCPDQFFLFFGGAYNNQSLAGDFPSELLTPKDDHPGSFLMRYKGNYYPMLMPYQVEEVQYDDPDDEPIL